MAIKKINTDLQIEAGLLDGDGNSGAANQILISTGTGIDWVDGSGSSIIGGPYLPLSAGASYPLTGTLYGTSTNYSGSGDYAGSLTLGTGASTQEAHLTIGQGRTGNGYSYIDLVGDATYTDYGLRVIRNNTGANTNSAIIHRGTGNLEISTIESSSTLFKTAGSERMRITSSGNVGIGTTSPGNFTGLSFSDPILDVAGIVQSRTGNIALGGTSYRKAALMTSTGTDAPYLDLRVSGSGTSSSTTTRMRIDSSGNVGIGTTIPTSKLQINDGSANITKAMQSGGVDHDFLQLSYAGSWVNNIGGLASINFTDSLLSSNTVGRIGVTYTGSQGKFVVTDLYSGGYGASGDVFTIQADGKTYIKGNVGIGTTSPNTKLHVAGIAQVTESGNSAFYGGNYVRMFNDQNYNFRNSGGTTIANIAMSGNSYFNGGNVGIGTTSPSTKLEVASSGAEGILISKDTGTPSNSGRLFFETDTISEGFSFLNSNGLMTIRSQAQAGVTSGNVRVAIDGSGNVGIGTTDPVNKLNVNGDIGYIGVIGQGSIYGNTGNSSYANMQLYNPSTGYSTFNNQSYGYYFNTSGGTKLTILNNGNVGIGTTSPSYKLDVDGEARFGDNGGVLLTDDSGTSYVRALNNHLNLRTTRDADDIYFSTGTTTTTKMFIQGDTGNVGIGTTSPAEKLEVNGNIRLGNSASLLWGSNNLTLKTASSSTIGVFSLAPNSSGTVYAPRFQMLNASNTVGVSIRTDANSYFNGGNVGIGTTSPAVQLELGNNTADEKLRLTGAASGKPLMTFYNTTTKIGQIASSSVGVTVTSLGSGNMSFENGGGTRLVIENGGNVGIGTATPSEKLHVTGNARVTGAYYDSNNSPGTADQVLVSTVTGTDWQDLSASGVDGTGTANKIAMWSDTDTITDAPITISSFIGQFTSTFTNHLKLNDNGELRIGSSNDLKIVHESNNNSYIQNATGDLYIRNFADDKDIIFQNDNGSGSIVTYFMLDGSTTHAYFSNPGNVGIGTTSPSAKLEVNGDIAVSGDNNVYSEGDTLTLMAGGTGGTYLMVNDLSGGVGIGTTSPSYKLDVDGTIRATGDVIAYSDVRVKENIKTIDNALEKVNKLRGVEFNKIGSEEKSIGVIAQEIEKVLPEVVKEDEKGMKSVAYGNIVGVLIEAVKDQQKQIDELKSIINGGTK